MQEGPAVPLTFYNETVKLESWAKYYVHLTPGTVEE